MKVEVMGGCVKWVMTSPNSLASIVIKEGGREGGKGRGVVQDVSFTSCLV